MLLCKERAQHGRGPMPCALGSKHSYGVFWCEVNQTNKKEPLPPICCYPKKYTRKKLLPLMTKNKRTLIISWTRLGSVDRPLTLLELGLKKTGPQRRKILYRCGRNCPWKCFFRETWISVVMLCLFGSEIAS